MKVRYRYTFLSVLFLNIIILIENIKCGLIKSNSINSSIIPLDKSANNSYRNNDISTYSNSTEKLSSKMIDNFPTSGSNDAISAIIYFVFLALLIIVCIVECFGGCSEKNANTNTHPDQNNNNTHYTTDPNIHPGNVETYHW
jgi:hypothetical protein